MAKAAGNNVLANQCNEKIQVFRTKYDDLCKNVKGLEPKLDRMASYRGKSLTNGGNGGIIKENVKRGGVADVQYIGKLDKNIYKCITQDIRTDEVIITDERIQHIKDRHPNDYEQYFKYAEEIIKSPDYILEANKPNSAFILKHIKENGKNYEMILRLQTSKDAENYMNSIITFLKVEEKRYKRYLRTKKILYKSE